MARLVGFTETWSSREIWKWLFHIGNNIGDDISFRLFPRYWVRNKLGEMVIQPLVENLREFGIAAEAIGILKRGERTFSILSVYNILSINDLFL